MELRSIKLLNFGHFEEVSVDFVPEFNLLVGNNSSGKTTILNGLAVAIGSILTLMPEQESRQIRPKDVRTVLENTKSEKFENSVYPVIVKATARFDNRKNVTWSRTLTGPRRRTTSGQLKELSKVFQDVDYHTNLPLVAFYGSGRLWREPYELGRVERHTRYDGYYRAIDPRVNSSQFINWMKKQAYADIQDGQSSAYHNVCKTIAKCFVEEDVRVHYNIRREQLEVSSKNISVAFGHLSDGQRSVVSMIGDLAVRAVTLNPNLDENASQNTKGVVLIDEIDLHLHPKWQRVFVNVLRDAFPRIQFIATTHSPFIIQGMKGGRVINLDKPGHVETEETFDRSIEEIVQHIQGIENPYHGEEHERKAEQAVEFLQLLRHPSSTQTEKEMDDILERLSDDPATTALLRFEREANKLDNV